MPAWESVQTENCHRRPRFPTGVFKDDQLRASYAEGEGIVNELRLGPRGALWAATQGGLTRIKDGNVTTLLEKNRLPCDAVQWTVEAEDYKRALALQPKDSDARTG